MTPGIIQHNIPAMSAYANYSANMKALNSNLQKLSSAYRINSAADDAAGLAISEKMRAQISGLETAQKNAKDGISLVQSAEGALTEVHSMLNRMVTLAEQAANGTYSDDLDREQIQKEIEQLNTEINRIADSTNFNGIKLLDGTLDTEYATTVTKDSAISNIRSSDYVAAGVSKAFSVSDVVDRPAAQVTQTNASFTIDLSDITASGFKNGDVINLDIGSSTGTTRLSVVLTSDAGQNTVATANSGANGLAQLFARSGASVALAGTGMTYRNAASSAGQTTDPDSATDIWESFSGASATTGSSTADWTNAISDGSARAESTAGTDVTYNMVMIDGHAWRMDVTTDGDQIKFTQVDKMDKNASDVNPDYSVTISVDDKKASPTGSNAPGTLQATDGTENSDGRIGRIVEGTTSSGQSAIVRVVNPNTGLAIGSSHQAEAKVTFDLTQLTDGDKLVAGDRTFIFKLGADSTTDYSSTSAQNETIVDLSTIFQTEQDQFDAVKQAKAMDKIALAINSGSNAYYDQSGDLQNGTKPTGAVDNIQGKGSYIYNVGNGGVDGNGMGTLVFQSQSISTDDDIQDPDGDGSNTDWLTFGGVAGNTKIDLTSAQNVADQFYFTTNGRSATTSFDVDVTKIKAGDTFDIDGKTFEFTDGATASTSGAVAIDLSSFDIAGGINPLSRHNVLTRIGDYIQGNAALSISPAFSVTGSNGVATPKYTVEINDNTIKLTSNEDYGTPSVFEARTSAAIDLPTETTYGKGLTLQIGDTAESFNQLKVSIKDMHVESLGLGDISVLTQADATDAMAKIKEAINYVSDVRGTLGATQNRLDHTINNLTAMQTNIQDAESAIRDTDVAAMMMEYTKNNIKVQAAQAMLAQANQLPQGVLQMMG